MIDIYQLRPRLEAEMRKRSPDANVYILKHSVLGDRQLYGERMYIKAFNGVFDAVITYGETCIWLSMDDEGPYYFSPWEPNIEVTVRLIMERIDRRLDTLFRDTERLRDELDADLNENRDSGLYDVGFFIPGTVRELKRLLPYEDLEIKVPNDFAIHISVMGGAIKAVIDTSREFDDAFIAIKSTDFVNGEFIANSGYWWRGSTFRTKTPPVDLAEVVARKIQEVVLVYARKLSGIEKLADELDQELDT